MRRILEASLGLCFLLALSPLSAGQTVSSPAAPPSDGSAPNAGAVTVRKVAIDGIEALVPSITELAKQRIMAGEYPEDQLGSESAARLRRVLFSYGYMQAVVAAPSVHRAEDGAGAVDLQFQVNPGPRYSISGLAVGGTQALPLQQIRSLIPLNVGDPVDGETLHHALDEIRRVYVCAGYLDVNPLPLDDYRRMTRTDYITVQVREGAPSKIASVKVVGLDAGLAEKVSALHELQPESLFSECRMRQAIEALLHAGDSSSKPLFSVRAEKKPAPYKVDVVIDFSPNQAKAQDAVAGATRQR